MRSPSSEISDNKNTIAKDVKTPKIKGYIDNISSPFKENLLSCSKQNYPFTVVLFVNAPTNEKI